MASRKTLNTVLQWWKGKNSFQDDSDSPESHNQENSSRILDIERGQQAERAALTQCAERLCASQRVHSKAVLERLGFSVQHDTIPSPQAPTYARKSPEPSLRGRRIRPILPPLNVENSNIGQTPKTNQTFDEEDPFFEKKLRVGSQMAIVSIKLAKLADVIESPRPDNSMDSSVDSLSSVDTHTPIELRAMSHMNFTPTPPPPPAIRRSRIPVMAFKNFGAGKEVAGGCMLQSAKYKVEELVKKVEQLQLVDLPSPHPPAAPRKSTAAHRKTPAAPAKAPAAPTKPPAVPRKVPAAPTKPPAVSRKTLTPMVPTPPAAAPTFRQGPRRGTRLNPLKAGSGASRNDLKPLVNPSESLSLFFNQIKCDDWEKKVEGLKVVQVLARHHSELLLPKLHEVCLILEEEVANLRSAVACAAIDSVAELHVNLGKAMDPEAERTGRALLLKLAQTTNVFIHQQVNLALDVLVDGCSPGRIMNALLNVGLSHRCAAVRGSTAQHLSQLAGIIGEDQIFASGKIFAERFLIAVSKMSVDPAPEVRRPAQKMLQELAHQDGFMLLWSKVIPVKDRRPLQKILMKMKQ